MPRHLVYGFMQAVDLFPLVYLSPKMSLPEAVEARSRARSRSGRGRRRGMGAPRGTDAEMVNGASASRTLESTIKSQCFTKAIPRITY